MTENTTPPFIELSAQPSSNPSKHPADNMRRSHCEDWRKSGLSMSEYCRRTGLSVSSLSGWLKKFHDTSTTESKINSIKMPAPARKQGVEIILVSGIRLRLAEMGNVSELLRLIKALESCS